MTTAISQHQPLSIVDINDNNVESMFQELEGIMMKSNDTLPTVSACSDASCSSMSMSSSHDDFDTHFHQSPLHISAPVESLENSIYTYYDVKPTILGQGTFGFVRECVEKATGKVYAVKSLHKEGNYRDILQREVAMLKQVDKHRNVIRLQEVFEDAYYFHIVTELCSGGELFDAVMNGKYATEQEAATVIKSILESVAYLHDKDIVHRDLKPENFLLNENQDPTELKLIDFGLAVTHDEYYDAPMSDVVGSPYYMAPEVLKKSYTKACDIWSVGVVTYILIFGYPPFHGETDEEIFDKIRKGHFNMESGDSLVSDEAKDFIKCLLKRDPRRRYTAERALSHPWLVKQTTTTTPMM